MSEDTTSDAVCVLFLAHSHEAKMMIGPYENPGITFSIDDEVLLELKFPGEILVRGKHVADNTAVVQALEDFARGVRHTELSIIMSAASLAERKKAAWEMLKLLSPDARKELLAAARDEFDRHPIV